MLCVMLCCVVYVVVVVEYVCVRCGVARSCARGAGTHGDVLNGRFGRRHGEEGECHRQFCLPKFAHVGVVTWSQRSTKE